MRRPEQPEDIVGEAIGRLMAFWGFRRNLGRVWAALFLSKEPLSQAELAERLSLSAGSVSMAIAELERWGAAQRLQDERRERYAVEPDIWGTVSRVMAQREAREVDLVSTAFARAARAIDEQGARGAAEGDADAEADARFRHARIEELQELAAAGRDLLRLVLGEEELESLVRRRRDAAPPRIPRAPEDD